MTVLCVAAPDGLPEVRSGHDLAAVLVPVLTGTRWPDGSRGLADGDVVVVTSKVVSKAEGRAVAAQDREAAITAQTVREVARVTRGTTTTRIVENRQGLVMAAAGVDASNVEDGVVLLLPVDPDASARRLCRDLRAATGVTIGVVLSDTVGRPWRQGVVDIAIGAAGVIVAEDHRGTVDTHGRRLDTTVVAVVDQIASAAELVKGKATGRPVAVVRGLHRWVTQDDGPGAAALIRSSEEDLFRLGSAEAYAEGRAAGLAEAARNVSTGRSPSRSTVARTP